MEEELKSKGWIAYDNTIPQNLAENGIVYLIVEPIGCWNISRTTQNDTVNLALYYFVIYSISLQVEVKDQPVRSQILLEDEISMCDVHRLLLKFCNSHNDKIYQTFVDIIN